MASQKLIDLTTLAITDPVIVRIDASVIPATLVAEGLTGFEFISVLVSIDGGTTTQQSYQDDSEVKLTATNNTLSVNTPITIGLVKPVTISAAGVFLSSGTASV